jgi:hypothetical protein
MARQQTIPVLGQGDDAGVAGKHVSVRRLVAAVSRTRPHKLRRRGIDEPGERIVRARCAHDALPGRPGRTLYRLPCREGLPRQARAR